MMFNNKRYAPLLSAVIFVATSEAFAPTTTTTRTSFVAPLQRRAATILTASTSEEAAAAAASSPQPALSAGFDGKRVLPYRILSAGLKGQEEAVPAVYAVLNKSYKRGQDGWDAAVHVGVTQDLKASLECHVEEHGAETVAHIRALSFPVPQPNAMQQVADDWKNLAVEAGATLDNTWADDVLSYLYDDDDVEDDEDFAAMTAEAMASTGEDTIVSPFAEDGAAQDDDSSASNAGVADNDDVQLEFNEETVDKVLDEVRPYLIADGGNVAVERVDPDTMNVYLKLEGACGSCASSTVTMQMGIERVLREKYANLNEVLQVEDDSQKPQELTREAVEDEVNRLGNAVIAMGGVARLLDVQPETGVVKLFYKGPEKVRQALEMAVQDVPFVETIEFTEEDEE